MTIGGELFAEIADQPRLGGKARSLARLAAAGLPIPPGFVVTDALFRALCPRLPALPPTLDAGALADLQTAAAALESAPFPPGFTAALAERLRALGGDRFAVRSSFADEDRAGALAPGVYESRVGVAAGEVEPALRAVLGSALGAGAAAYAHAHGGTAGQPPVAVLIHRHLSGDSQGAAAVAGAQAPVVIDSRGQPPSAAARALLERSLPALAARHGPVEVEWVADGDAVTFLQLRPYQAPPPPRHWPPLSQLADDPHPEAWRWDAPHNPLPLSQAHASLITMVDQRCAIGLRQRVLGSYLFYRPDPPSAPSPSPSPSSSSSASASASASPTADDLLTHLTTLDHDITAHRHALPHPPTLTTALTGFFPLYQRLFGVLQPATRAARRALADLLRAHLPGAIEPLLPALLAEIPSRATDRARLAGLHAASPPAARAGALATYLALFGDEAPRWDIAATTYAEDPAALTSARPGRDPTPAADQAPPPPSPPGIPARSTWQTAAAAVRARLPPAQHLDFDRRLTAARAAVAAGEDDDWLYARLQAPVRRAVLALGQRLAGAGVLARPADAFHLPLDWLQAFEAGTAPASEATALAARGQATLDAARRDPPPLPSHPEDPGSTGLLRGHGTAGRALGRVVHHHGPRPESPGGTAPADAVLVAVSLLPTELPLLQVAALVTETGGPLDHVAAQARERGLPAVVGVAGALAQLPEGALVLVDADRGLVVRCF